MKSDYRFLKQLFLLTLGVGIVGAVLFLTLFKEYYLSVFPALLAFFAIMTLTFHHILEGSFKKSPKNFSYMFMGLSAGKLFLMLLMIVVYLILRRDTVIPFLAGTFLLYLVFTLFEVKTLLRMVQDK